MASAAPSGEARKSATVAPARESVDARVSTVGPLPGAAGDALSGASVRLPSAASVTWTACEEPECGGSGLIGRLCDADGACTSTVTVRSPLGLVDFEQLQLVRELGAPLRRT